jgi:hypothetical protein
LIHAILRSESLFLPLTQASPSVRKSHKDKLFGGESPNELPNAVRE